jgi:hypothetical protein
VNIGIWWRRKSGAAKTMAVLLLLLALQIGLCIATPSLDHWADSISHKPQGEDWGTFGLVLWELYFLLLTLLLLVIAALWWLVGWIAGKTR